MPVFGGENEESDLRAQQIMAKLCPDRKIIPVYARDILTGGGNIHCITQQIPLYGIYCTTFHIGELIHCAKIKRTERIHA